MRGVSSDKYKKGDECILNLPALNHNHFNGAHDVHGAFCGV